MSVFYLNFVNVVSWVLLLIVATALSTFLSVPVSTLTLIDILPRLDTNDNYLHMYPLFWTNFWFLPMFYFLLTVIFTYSLRTNLLLLSVYLIYITELQDFNLLNFTYSSYELTQFNNLLTNNLNKYHPFLFFLSTHVCFMLIYVVTSSTWVLVNFSTTWNLLVLKRSNNYFTPLSLVALSLGGLWAFQEASWGGFWNWDSSETFGLLFLMTSLYVLHSNWRQHHLLQLGSNLVQVVFILLVMYCFIQLNFDLISHNFGVKFLHLFSNSFFYKEVIGFLSCACYCVWYLNWSLARQMLFLTTRPLVSNYYNPSLLAIFWWQLIFTLSGFILYGSLSQLISYTAFTLFQINSFNVTVSVTYAVIVFYLYFIYWFTLPKTLIPLSQVIAVISNTNFIYFLPATVFMRINPYYVLHSLLVWTTTINILAYKTNFLTWTIYSVNMVKWAGNSSLIASNVFLICDATFIDNYNQLNTCVTEVSWWISNFISNSPNINAFYLGLFHEGCSSWYQLTSGTIWSFITITTPYVSLLPSCVFGFVVFMGTWVRRLSYRF